MDRLPTPQPSRFDRREALRRSGIAFGAATAASLFGPATKAIAATGRTVANEGLAIARVWPRNAKQALALAHFDDTHAVFPDGSMEFLLWPGDRRRLDKLGMRYRITTADMSKLPRTGRRDAALKVQPGEVEDYRFYNDYILDMQALATQHPDKTRLFEYPELTLEGRKMYGLEIATNVAMPDGRPVVHIDGVHHAREWPSSELSLMFAFDLLESYGIDQRMTDIVDSARVVVTPIVNPDGFSRSRDFGDITDQDPGQLAAYWRKNERSFTDLFYAAGNPDAHGTDPNRNYSFYWGGEGGNADPTSQTYAGSAPFAEPESRNIANMMRGCQVTAYLTNHTHGRLVMRPWGYTADPSPDNDFQTDLGARMAAINGYTNQIGLSLYSTAGTSRDWSYAALRTIVYTFEHGRAFHAPYASTIPEMYAINREPFQILCEAGIDPANHGVLTGRLVDATGAPVVGEVRLHKSFETARGDGGAPVPETIDTSIPTGADGTFEYHVNPSTRPTVIQDGGGPEAWEVSLIAGGSTARREVIIERGERVDLGDVPV